MTKKFLVPAQGDGKTTDTSFRPKYLYELKLPWSGKHMPEKQVFLIEVDEIEGKKISQLEKMEGVKKLK